MNTTTGTALQSPVVTPEVVRDYAAEAGVCVRPLLRTVTDRATGRVDHGGDPVRVHA